MERPLPTLCALLVSTLGALAALPGCGDSPPAGRPVAVGTLEEVRLE